MKKRFLSIVLSILLAIGSCVPVTAEEIIYDSEETVIEEDSAVSVSECSEYDISDIEIVEEEAADQVVEEDSPEFLEEITDFTGDEELIVEDETTSEEVLEEEEASTGVADVRLSKHFNPDENSFYENLTDMIAEEEAAEDGAGYDEGSASDSEGALKRIIVYKSYKDLKSDYNAVRVASDTDMTILQFASQKATKKAYNSLVALYGDDNVFYDHRETVSDCSKEALVEEFNQLENAYETCSADTTVAKASDYTPEYFAGLMGADSFKKKMTYSMKQKEIIVAVIDTGLNLNHEKIKGKYVKGYSFYNDGSVMDDMNHGTWAAGCILGVTKGTNVKIMPIKTMDSTGSGYSSIILAGIKWAIKHGANIVNMSLGGTHSYCHCYEKAIEDAYNSKITFVVSAGNSNKDIDNPYNMSPNSYKVHPAAYRKCITVAATDRKMKKAYFSNYGAAVDVTNYGVDIYMPDSKGKTSYSVASGTSFSCPLTAGAVALLYESGVATKPADASKWLRNHAKDLGDKGWDKYYGSGIVRIGSINGFINPTLTLSVGRSRKYFSNPTNKTVKYSSSNKKVVSVDKYGKLTALKSGKSVITATLDGKKYTCAVTVINPRITGSGTVAKGKTITVKLVDVTKKTTWYSCNTNVVKVTASSSGSEKAIVKGLKKGTATIVAMNNGKTYVKTITVK